MPDTRNLKNGILEGSAIFCEGSAKVLREVADKADSAAKYCRDNQTGKFTFGFSFKLGSNVYKFGTI